MYSVADRSIQAQALVSGHVAGPGKRFRLIKSVQLPLFYLRIKFKLISFGHFLIYYCLRKLKEVTMKDEESALSKDFPVKLCVLRKNKGWSQEIFLTRIWKLWFHPRCLYKTQEI
jgi:hypothetical protein